MKTNFEVESNGGELLIKPRLNKIAMTEPTMVKTRSDKYFFEIFIPGQKYQLPIQTAKTYSPDGGRCFYRV